MRAQEFIIESATDEVYHYTGISSAYKILKSGKFALQAGVRDVEKTHQATNTSYFLSTTRSKVGDYHTRYQGHGDALFVLDGRILNQKYKTTPIDYWERMWSHSPDRSSESEDRVFSKDPYMPIDSVKAVHILLKPDDKGERGAWIRGAILEAKKRSIPVYVYDQKKYWIAQLPQKALSLKEISDYLTGEMPTDRFSYYDYKNRKDKYPSLFELVSLCYSRKVSDLSEPAIKLLQKVLWYSDTLTSSIKNDMHNAAKPNEARYPDLTKILKFMKMNGIKNLIELDGFLKAKWKIPYEEHLKAERERREKAELNEGWKANLAALGMAGAMAGIGGYALNQASQPKEEPQAQTQTQPAQKHIAELNQYANLFKHMAEKEGIVGTELAQLMAQSYVETMRFTRLSEMGNRNYFTRLYDIVSRPAKAKELGNTAPGDGERYKGRGFLHITGKTGYKKVGDLIGEDLVSNPELLENPEIGAKASIAFWKMKVRQRNPNWEDTKHVTKLVNGGQNHLEHRKKAFEYFSNLLNNQ
jgi:putative chitinase